MMACLGHKGPLKSSKTEGPGKLSGWKRQKLAATHRAHVAEHVDLHRVVQQLEGEAAVLLRDQARCGEGAPKSRSLEGLTLRRAPSSSGVSPCK